MKLASRVPEHHDFPIGDTGVRGPLAPLALRILAVIFLPIIGFLLAAFVWEGLHRWSIPRHISQLGVIGTFLCVVTMAMAGFVLLQLKRSLPSFCGGIELGAATIVASQLANQLAAAQEIWFYIGLGISLYLFAIGAEDLQSERLRLADLISDFSERMGHRFRKWLWG